MAITNAGGSSSLRIGRSLSARFYRDGNSRHRNLAQSGDDVSAGAANTGRLAACKIALAWRWFQSETEGFMFHLISVLSDFAEHGTYQRVPRLMRAPAQASAGRRLIRIAIVFVLNEVEDIEGFYGSIREKAIHRLLLIVEEFKGDGKFGQQEEFQMGLIKVQQRQPSASRRPRSP